MANVDYMSHSASASLTWIGKEKVHAVAIFSVRKKSSLVDQD